jgi:hypothetical protein
MRVATGIGGCGGEPIDAGKVAEALTAELGRTLPGAERVQLLIGRRALSG